MWIKPIVFSTSITSGWLPAALTGFRTLRFYVLIWKIHWLSHESSKAFDRNKNILSYYQVLYYFEVQMPQPVSLTLPWPSLSHCRGTFLKPQPLACSKSARERPTLSCLPRTREGRAAQHYLFISSQPHIFSLRPNRTTTAYPSAKCPARAFCVCQRQKVQWIKVRWRSNCKKVLMGQEELHTGSSRPSCLP